MESQNIMELEALMPVEMDAGLVFSGGADWQYHMGIPESLPVYPRH